MEILSQRPELKKIIHEVAKEQKFQNYTLTDVETNQKGEGFMGQIVMVSIEDSSKRLNLVIKSAFTDGKIREIAPIRNSFLNEILIYTKLEPAFRKLETDSGVAPYQFFPKCYKTCSHEKQEVLCLENLKALNFEVFDKKAILDDAHVSLIFKLYGRFHAYSFALKEKEPELYRDLADKLYNIYYELITIPNGSFAPFMKTFDVMFEKFFKPGQDDEMKQKFQKYRGDGIIEEYSRLVTEKCDFSIILHGDCWSNNMMFRYKIQENQRKPIDMRFLDLQLAKEGSPVCDLSYSLYSGASKSVFDNLDKYLRIYHSSLSKHLSEFGCDSGKLFPFEALQTHWKKYSRFGMILAFAVIKVKCIDQKHIVDYTDLNSSQSSENLFQNVEFNEDEFQKRSMELLHHMFEIDAL